MNFKDLINRLRESLKQVATRANEVLKTQPPLEQFEKTSPVYQGILSCGFAIDFLSQTVADVTRQLDAIDPVKAIEEGAADILKVKIEAGELIPKTKFDEMMSKGEILKKEDAQAAVDLAVKTAKEQIVDELKVVETRRKEVSTPKSATEPALLSLEVAAQISHDVLKADDYLDSVKKIASRVKELNELGVKAPQLLSAAATTPIDAAGDTTFTERLSLVRELAGGEGRTTAPEPFAGSRQGNSSADVNELEGAAF